MEDIRTQTQDPNRYAIFAIASDGSVNFSMIYNSNWYYCFGPSSMGSIWNIAMNSRSSFQVVMSNGVCTNVWLGSGSLYNH